MILNSYELRSDCVVCLSVCSTAQLDYIVLQVGTYNPIDEESPVHSMKGLPNACSNSCVSNTATCNLPATRAATESCFCRTARLIMNIIPGKINGIFDARDYIAWFDLIEMIAPM